MLTNKADADKPIIGGKWLSSRFWCGFSGIRLGSDSFAVKYVIFYFNLPVLGCRGRESKSNRSSDRFRPGAIGGVGCLKRSPVPAVQSLGIPFEESACAGVRFSFPP